MLQRKGTKRRKYRKEKNIRILGKKMKIYVKRYEKTVTLQFSLASELRTYWSQITPLVAKSKNKILLFSFKRGNYLLEI